MAKKKEKKQATVKKVEYRYFPNMGTLPRRIIQVACVIGIVVIVVLTTNHYIPFL